MAKNLLLFLLILLSYSIHSQNVVSYSFDGCNYSDASGTFGDATTSSDPECSCGLVEESMYFDGNIDHLTFPDNLDSILTEDFTLDFYFRLQATTQLSDIFSVRSQCNFDSLLAIKYSPINNMLVTEFGNNVGNFYNISTPLDLDLCWNRYTLVKSGALYTVYLNNEFVQSQVTDVVIEFSHDARAAFGQSPCLLNSEVRFRGWIDEFMIYQRPLSRRELNENYLYPDKIITSDTTIISGSEVPLTSGTSCFVDFFWEPQSTLDDSNSLDPIATPLETTTYHLTIDNEQNCRTTDSLTIYVVEKEDLDCSQLLLPTAFTPNNDNLNDRYGISNLFIVDEILSFEIYDRWGNKMWEGNQKNDQWDGFYEGNPVNAGVYLYQIKYTCSDTEQYKVDNFTVIR